MRIGIDARFYSQAGVGRYIRNLLDNLQKIDHQNEYVVFLLSDDLKKANLKNNFKKVAANFPWYGLSEQFKFPALLNQQKLDIMHFPHFNVPVFYRGKFIVTIHDLIHQHFRMERATTHGPLIYKAKQIGYNQVFSHAIKKSKTVITISEYVKTELINQWGLKNEKIAITKEAAEDSLVNVAKRMTADGIKKTLEKFAIQSPYIFYVGNAHPHKNVEGLIKAFLSINQTNPDLKLVLSGHDHYFWERIKKDYQNPSIIYTGFVSELELVALYKGAKLYVVPSFEEGFGIPLLEAMSCGTPVVASKLAATPEVGGDAAIYFDPKNIEDMAKKIISVLNNEKLRKELIEKGNKRFKEFSWSQLAEETLKIYRYFDRR